MTRQFGTWEKTCCDECGSDFQVTRTEPKTVDGPVVCGDCEMYTRGYKDGYEAGLKARASHIDGNTPVFMTPK